MRAPRSGGERTRRPAGPAPGRAALHEAALLHLSRFAATEAGLRRVLDRRIARWAHLAEAEATDADRVAAEAARARAEVAGVIARLVAAGAVNDATYAEARVRGLVRAGRSRRAVAAHLATKGVPAEVAQAALPDDPEAELAAALLQARRRHIGPFRRDGTEPDPEARRQELAALARAGFSGEVAGRALRMAPDAAEALIIRLRER